MGKCGFGDLAHCHAVEELLWTPGTIAPDAAHRVANQRLPQPLSLRQVQTLKRDLFAKACGARVMGDLADVVVQQTGVLASNNKPFWCFEDVWCCSVLCV